MSPAAIRALLRALSVSAAVAAALCGPASAQSVTILEPREWSDGAAATRGIVVSARQSLRVVGTASTPGGVVNVTVNGVRASLQPDGHGSTRFVGYVPVRDDTRAVEVVAYGPTGAPMRRSYTVAPTPAAQAYTRPEQAWAGGTHFKGKRWAVVVGVSQYHDARITPLQYADADARSFYQFLRSDQAGLGGFAEENVKLLVNEQANYRSIRSALFTFLKAATEDDVVVIYFAGHGMADPERPEQLYLLLNDSDMEDIAGSAFPMKDVSDAVRNIYARNVVVITDACHSAGVGGQIQGARGPVAVRAAGELNQINQAFLESVQASNGGSVIFTASGANQYSQEDARWGGGHGVFTYFLLQGLNGAADEDDDRIVTLGEMMEYTRDNVRRETRNAQIPTISQTSYDDAWPMSIVPGNAPHVGSASADSARAAPGGPGRAGPAAAAIPNLTLGQQVTSALDDSDSKLPDGSYYEEWLLSAQRGQRVTVTMKSTAFDSYLMVQQDGGTFQQMDDDSGGGNDARISFTAPATGLYRFRANSRGANAMGAYALSAESGAAPAPAAQTVAPTTASDIAAARALAAGQTVSGTLGSTDRKLTDGSYYQPWKLSLRRGQSVNVTMRSTAFDTYLMVEQDGGGYSRNDDDSGGRTDSRIAFTAPETGTYLVRANSRGSGATGAYTLQVVDESSTPEPSSAVASAPVVARPLAIGASVTDSLGSGDPKERDGTYYQPWRFTGRRGQAVNITLKSSAFDAYLLMEGPGRSFWVSNDDGAGGTDSRILATLPADGEYTVKANAFREGGTGAYELSSTSTGIARNPQPAMTGTPIPITAGQTLSGTITAANPMASDSSYYQDYRYEGHRGESMTITLKSKAFDSWLVVSQPGGYFMLSDDDSGGYRDSKLTFTFPADGTYLIRANTLGKREIGDYTLQVDAVR
ncbi:MAG TPA: pre-peptidase C-terminal domain-containing protein [Longimicrobiaceae bacterium]|nr:pre-peptidase C-terminal domain-containing protein [Longimicrobiaceae bacterium]